MVAHVNGDTFDVKVGGWPKRIHLLNIDTPETADLYRRPPQCLGPEAAQFLAAMLPIGTPVRLEFDKKHKDDSGRTLAAAFTPNGRMVNAELARAGFARVVTDDENVRFRPLIEQAAQEAADNKRGLHSQEVQCTLPGRVAAISNSVAQEPTLETQPRNATSYALYAAVWAAYKVVGTAKALIYDLDHARGDIAWAVLTVAEQTQLRAQTRTVADTVGIEQTAMRDAANVAKVKEDLAAQRAARAKADRADRKWAAAHEAEQRRAEAEAHRRADAEHQQGDAQNQETEQPPEASAEHGEEHHVEDAPHVDVDRHHNSRDGALTGGLCRHHWWC